MAIKKWRKLKYWEQEKYIYDFFINNMNYIEFDKEYISEFIQNDLVSVVEPDRYLEGFKNFFNEFERAAENEGEASLLSKNIKAKILDNPQTNKIIFLWEEFIIPDLKTNKKVKGFKTFDKKTQNKLFMELKNHLNIIEKENETKENDPFTFLLNAQDTIKNNWEKNLPKFKNELEKINENKNDIIKLHFNIDVNEKSFNLDGTSTIQEFKEIMGKLNNDERAHMQKELRKQFNSHLKLFAPEKLNVIPPIDKEITLKEKTWKDKYYDLKQEFDDFKIEVKDLITELKLEIKILNQKVNYYDSKYNNEYDKMKSKGNQNLGR